MNVQAFTPGQTLTLSVTTSAVTGTFTTGAFRQSCLLSNTGTTLCFVRFSTTNNGGSVVNATTSDLPIPAGETMVMCKGEQNTISAICATGSTTLYATAGEGQ